MTEQDMQPQALRPLWRVLKDLGLTRWRHLLKWSAFLLVFAIGVAIYDAYKENERGDLTAYSLEASRVMYAGGDPYSKEMVGQNYKYLPLNAVVLGPLTLVPVPLAQGVWLSLNLGLLILCYHNHQMLLHRVKRIPWWVWIIALALTMRYTYASWKMGQWNTPVYALMFTGIVMARRSPFFGGSVIGLAGALKFMPALLVFYYAAMRDWRAFWGLMTGLVFWALVFPTLMLGPARHGELLLGFWEKSQGSYGYMMDTQSVVGESLHATLVGYLTPAPRSNVTGGGDVPFNLVELDPVLARNIVKGLMVAMFATTVMFTWWLGQVGIHKSAVGTFLLVGLWFLVFLSVSPSVRRATMLSMFTPALGLALVLAMKETPPMLRRLVGASIGLSFLFMLLGSGFVTGDAFSTWAHIHGAYTYSVISLMAGCVVWLVAFQRRAMPAEATAPISDPASSGQILVDEALARAGA